MIHFSQFFNRILVILVDTLQPRLLW